MKGVKTINFYHKDPKISDTQKFAVITLKFEQGYNASKNVDGMTV